MINEAYKIRRFLTDVATCGAAYAIKAMQPETDMITQRKAYCFFAKDDAKYGGNHGEAWVKRQVEKGTVKPRRKGRAKNSPLYYSKAELIKAKNDEDAIAFGIFDGTTL